MPAHLGGSVWVHLAHTCHAAPTRAYSTHDASVCRRWRASARPVATAGAMADCSFARCVQERRAIRRELQRWTKNMVYVLGLERVAEELMGRRKWKLYQEALLPRPEPGSSGSSERDSPPAPPPAQLKIKTIEQINTQQSPTILESLMRRAPADWRPPDRCYFCAEGETETTGRTDGADGEPPPPAVEGGAAGRGRDEGGARGTTSPAESESDSSSGSGGARSPGGPPALLAHLLNQNPQTLAQFQTMAASLAAVAALGGGLVPPALLSQAWYIRAAQHSQLMQQQQHADRLSTEAGDKATTTVEASEQPLDLSAKSSSASGGTATPPAPDALPTRVPIDPKFFRHRMRMGQAALGAAAAAGVARRAYTEDELQSALRDILSGKLGTRRAAVQYGIPRSTLRNKVYKLAVDRERAPDDEDAPDEEWAHAARLLLDAEEDDEPRSDPLILKVPAVRAPRSPVPEDEPGTSRTASPPPDPSNGVFTLRDVIAHSISQKFQQEPPAPTLRHVSVIQAPPAPPVAPAPPNNGAAAAGGKGTRPKRGKYRNYDRDSLVEAVKAVQRGEMSVHRAGSYYGVPHSTLEYKVKERHLMRPRKREPKQPPLEERAPAAKPPDATRLGSVKQQPKGNPTFAGAPNGLKTPPAPFEGSLGYGPQTFPFWPPPGGFPGLAVAGASAAPPTAPTFPPAPDLFASHMMQRLREESARSPAPTANGSFLEGIIRSSLERAPTRPGALLERLAAPTATSAAGGAASSEVAESPPPARRPRLSSADRLLAEEMREAVKRLRADRLRSPPPTPTPATAADRS